MNYIVENKQDVDYRFIEVKIISIILDYGKPYKCFFI